MCGNSFANIGTMPNSVYDEKRGRFVPDTLQKEPMSSDNDRKDPDSFTDRLNLLDVSPDVILHILSFLSFKDVLHFGSSCKVAYALVESDRLWMRLCEKWGSEVQLSEWSSQMNSGKALFRLLHRFEAGLGTWVAQDLTPRGGLLHLSQDNLSVVAHRIMPGWPGEGLSCRRIFEIVGSSDGTSSVFLQAGRGHCNPLPGKLVWDSEDMSEFHLEAETKLDHGSSISGAGTYSERQIVSRNGAGSQIQGNEGSSPGNQEMEHSTDVSDVGAGSGRNRSQGQEDFRRRAAQYFSKLSASCHTGSVSLRDGSSAPGSAELAKKPSSSAESTPRKHYLPVPSSRYKRLRSGSPGKGRELVGLWSGVYGPHGLEILSVDYTEDGMICARKVLGDPNVPCGEFSFRAFLDTETVDVPSDVNTAIGGGHDPHSMDSSDPPFVKSFRGQGRIAGQNFRDPRWVDGDLLVKDSNQISFLWRDVVNFIVHFQRLSLSDLVEEQQKQRQAEERAAAA